ncbi:hypothetical protein BDU57DRAFT_496197 [Ampelomyces quisqualis]|uniref:Uncharacterized protein n=1 Tax=Ampelomyces quisqualis TaxID=50730 RepID=A0A6A5QK07_AMPQU|nr:hypothetical protein BDU57DRAFT_496197 [Ampelomyces quisqualis]
MKTSKYAPKTPAETLAQSRTEKLRQDKDKTTRLLGRLRWKADLLYLSYFKALEIVRACDAQNGGNQGTESKHAESMFKVDFFEFYTLLERYITACLCILGITVSGVAPSTNVNALRYLTNSDLHKTRPIASHAFHANLIEALDDEKCPLHASFGVHNIRAELGLAKDFRNAWKDADERVIASKWNNEKDSSRRNITLHDSQLKQMLHALLSGCEHAHGVVQQYTTVPMNSSGFSRRDFESMPQSQGNYSLASEETPFESMEDAMELD